MTNHDMPLLQSIPYSYLTIEKTETGLTITVPNWRIEREIYVLALWGMIAFLMLLCYVAWPFRADVPVATTDCLVFSLLIVGLVFLFGKIVWDSKGKRIVTITGDGIRVERFCLFRFSRREFSTSDLLRLDRNVEKISMDRKPPVLTLDILLKNSDRVENGIFYCSLPCLNEGEFNELTDTLRPFLPESDPTPRGNLIRVENEAGTLRVLPVKMSGEAPWWTVAFSLLLVWGCAVGISRLIEFTEMPFGLIFGLILIACSGPVAVAFMPFLYRCCHRVRSLTLSPDRFEMETSLFDFSRVRRIDFPEYRGIRQTYRQVQTDRPVIWSVEILVGRKRFCLDTGSLHEQVELAATINNFLGFNEEKILNEPRYFKFIRDEKGIRFPLQAENIDVNGVAAIGVVFVFVVFLGILFVMEKFPEPLLATMFLLGLPAILIATIVWSSFGKCLIRTTENTLEIFRRFPFYQGKPFIIDRNDIEAIQSLPPFANVAETPWGTSVYSYSIEIVRKEKKSVVLPCNAMEEQIWLARALKHYVSSENTDRSSLAEILS